MSLRASGRVGSGRVGHVFPEECPPSQGRPGEGMSIRAVQSRAFGSGMFSKRKSIRVGYVDQGMACPSGYGMCISVGQVLQGLVSRRMSPLPGQTGAGSAADQKVSSHRRFFAENFHQNPKPHTYNDNRHTTAQHAHCRPGTQPFAPPQTLSLLGLRPSTDIVKPKLPDIVIARASPEHRHCQTQTPRHCHC